MDNDLNRYFVNLDIYLNNDKLHTVIVPSSLLHDAILLWKYPGSPFVLHVIDHTGNYRLNTNILDT